MFGSTNAKPCEVNARAIQLHVTRELAAGPGVTILCGRFEGFDERIFAGRQVEEVSIGDYVLTSGNLAAMDAWCNTLLTVPESDTFKAQELHLPLYHALCLMVEEELFGDG